MMSKPLTTQPLSPTWCPVHGEGCGCKARIEDAAELEAEFSVSEVDSLREMSELDWLEYLLAVDQDRGEEPPWDSVPF